MDIPYLKTSNKNHMTVRGVVQERLTERVRRGHIGLGLAGCNQACGVYTPCSEEVLESFEQGNDVL